jgi:hypothetical protein
LLQFNAVHGGGWYCGRTLPQLFFAVRRPSGASLQRAVTPPCRSHGGGGGATPTRCR